MPRWLPPENLHQTTFMPLRIERSVHERSSSPDVLGKGLGLRGPGGDLKHVMGGRADRAGDVKGEGYITPHPARHSEKEEGQHGDNLHRTLSVTEKRETGESVVAAAAGVKRAQDSKGSASNLVDMFESASGLDLDGDHMVAGGYRVFTPAHMRRPRSTHVRAMRCDEPYNRTHLFVQDPVSSLVDFVSDAVHARFLRWCFGVASTAEGRGPLSLRQTGSRPGLRLRQAPAHIESQRRRPGIAGWCRRVWGTAEALPLSRSMQQLTIRASLVLAFAGSVGLMRWVSRRVLPPLIAWLESGNTEVLGLDMRPDALLRNLADAAVEVLFEDKWVLVAGWGGAKKYLVGVDEEESGLWAGFKGALFGQHGGQGGCPFWLWRASRWAALGLPDAEGEGGMEGVAVGVRVRHEKDSPGTCALDGHEGPAWCDAVRNCADGLLEAYWGGNTWQWAKRLIFNVDEEEGTGQWRLLKTFGYGLPTGAVGVYTIQQPDQYPLLLNTAPFFDSMAYVMLGIWPSPAGGNPEPLAGQLRATTTRKRAAPAVSRTQQSPTFIPRRSKRRKFPV